MSPSRRAHGQIFTLSSPNARIDASATSAPATTWYERSELTPSNSVKVVKKVRSYQDKLDQEIQADREAHGKKELPPKDGPGDPGLDEQESVQSTTDPESGLFHKGEHKEVFAYSVQTSCDENGWILGFEAYPGNLHDSTTFFSFYEQQIQSH